MARKRRLTMEEMHDIEQKKLESFSGRCQRSNPRRKRKKRKSRGFSWKCPRRSCGVRRGAKRTAKRGLAAPLLVAGALAAALYFGVLK